MRIDSELKGFLLAFLYDFLIFLCSAIFYLWRIRRNKTINLLVERETPLLVKNDKIITKKQLINFEDNNTQESKNCRFAVSSSAQVLSKTSSPISSSYTDDSNFKNNELISAYESSLPYLINTKNVKSVCQTEQNENISTQDNYESSLPYLINTKNVKSVCQTEQNENISTQDNFVHPLSRFTLPSFLSFIISLFSSKSFSSFSNSSRERQITFSIEKEEINKNLIDKSDIQCCYNAMEKAEKKILEDSTRILENNENIVDKEVKKHDSKNLGFGKKILLFFDIYSDNDNHIEDTCHSETKMYLTFLKNAQKLFIRMSFIGIFLVLPVNLSHVKLHGLETFFDRAAAINIVSGCYSIWVLFFVTLIYSFMSYYFIYKYWKSIQELKKPRMQQNFAESFTLMIRGMSKNETNALSLFAYFNRLMLGKVVAAHIILDYTRMKQKYLQLKEIRRSLFEEIRNYCLFNKSVNNFGFNTILNKTYDYNVVKEKSSETNNCSEYVNNNIYTNNDYYLNIVNNNLDSCNNNGIGILTKCITESSDSSTFFDNAILSNDMCKDYTIKNECISNDMNSMNEAEKFKIIAQKKKKKQNDNERFFFFLNSLKNALKKNIVSFNNIHSSTFFNKDLCFSNLYHVVSVCTNHALEAFAYPDKYILNQSNYLKGESFHFSSSSIYSKAELLNAICNEKDSKQEKAQSEKVIQAKKYKKKVKDVMQAIKSKQTCENCIVDEEGNVLLHLPQGIENSHEINYLIDKYIKQLKEIKAMSISSLKSTGTGFISFLNVKCVMECLLDPRTVGVNFDWEIEAAPPPEDIIWKNIHFSTFYLNFRIILLNIFLIFVSLCVVTPVTVLNELSPLIDNLENAFEESRFIRLTVTSWIPPLILIAINSLVQPQLVYWIAHLTGYWRRSQLVTYILHANFVFLILNTLIIPLMSLRSIAAVLEIMYKIEIQRWSVTLGSMLLSSSGSFVLRYLLSSSFLTSSNQLIQLPKLSAETVQSYILGGKSSEKWPFDFGYWYAFIVSIFTVVLVFSVVVPLVLPLGVLFFTMKYYIDKANFKNGVWKVDVLSKGIIASNTIKYMLFAVSFLQFGMGGFFISLKDKYSVLAGTFLLIISIVCCFLLVCHWLPCLNINQNFMYSEENVDLSADGKIPPEHVEVLIAAYINPFEKYCGR